MRSQGKVLVAVVWCVALLNGCGQGSPIQAGSEEKLTISKIGESVIGKCLAQGGANLAESHRDLHFFTDARADEEVSNPGFALDRHSGQRVNVWRPPERNGQSIGWLVWVAQGVIQQELSPLEAVEREDEKIYVAYVNEPSPEQRNVLEGCIDLSAPPPGQRREFDPTPPGTVAD